MRRLHMAFQTLTGDETAWEDQFPFKGLPRVTAYSGRACDLYRPSDGEPRSVCG
jgi:hypothetical protein